MKLLNKSSRDIAVQDPFLGRSVTVAAGAVGDFSAPAAADLLSSFPSDWEAESPPPPPTKKFKEL